MDCKYCKHPDWAHNAFGCEFTAYHNIKQVDTKYAGFPCIEIQMDEFYNCICKMRRGFELS